MGLELLTDIEKIFFLDSALYGGFSAVTKPYARANTPAMGEKYKPHRKRRDIIMVDCISQVIGL